MTKIKAYAVQDAKSPLTPFNIERRTPADHDVAIDIKYCGICHSDIHQARNEWGGSIYPMVPGHEITGIVTQVGNKVKKYKIGDRVGVGCLVDSCRNCEHCAQHLEQFCDAGFSGTYNSRERDGKTPTYGGYSERIVVNEDFVLRIPDNLPLDKAAPLLCAGITTYSPLMHWHAGPGKKVAVVGMGGLGHMAVKIAHALGAEVTVLSHSDKKRQDAEKFGAKYFYTTDKPENLKRLQKTFDLMINTVPDKVNFNDLLALLKSDATMVLVGVSPTSAQFDAHGLIIGRKSISGSLIGGLKETQEMLDFCAKHDIVSEIEMISIQDVNAAYERVVKSDVRYRFVINMASLKS